ncbi:hypothetical protein ElyMa_005663100 [Elysia marginata]|uniref:Uncharacterized protein n=1 Tax=Elysia marginata TaxID=1093978 RepID=A0AAV4FEN8_9GAST|nr:hypothetical protein ElyMa_005663100 [Elysia marginata]
MGTPRPQVLQRRKKGATETQRIPLFTYNCALPNISNTGILKTYLRLLHLSNRCKKAIPELPMTALRRRTNIRNILLKLVRSTTPSNNSSGFKPCNTPQCKTCPLHIQNIIF